MTQGVLFISTDIGSMPPERAKRYMTDIRAKVAEALNEAGFDLSVCVLSNHYEVSLLASESSNLRIDTVLTRGEN